VRGVLRASVTDGSGLSAGVALQAAAVAGQLAADQKLGRLDSSRQPRLGGDPLLRRDKRRDLAMGTLLQPRSSCATTIFTIMAVG